MAKELTTKQLNALVKELTECLATNLFKANEPGNWAQRTLEWIENHPAKSWGWNLPSVLDLQLQGIESWDSLTAEDRQVVAKEIVRLLEAETSK